MPTEPKTIRTFIAVELPPEVKAYLGRLSADLAAQLPQRSVRWVKPERIHLTLRFIGETEKNLMPDLQNMMDETARGRRPFLLHLKGIGCFPNCSRPRVIWVGIQGDLEAAALLKSDLDAGLSELGWEIETRSFQPHLTLGRVKDLQSAADQRWPAGIEPLAITVQSIHLIESNLTPAGPIYTTRHTSRFEGR
jgi:RNA 2',3'-cyclic 3'-phosphodiesterase